MGVMDDMREMRRAIASLQQQAAAQLANYEVTVDTVSPLVVTLPSGEQLEGATPVGVQPRAGMTATLQVGGGRSWLLPSVAPDDLAPGEVPDQVLMGIAQADLARERIIEQITEQAADLSDAALIAGSAAGVLVQAWGESRPTARKNGVDLADGDILYVLNQQGHIADVRIRLAGGADDGWPKYVFAAADVLATGSIIGSLIAASQAIQSPVITGGTVTGSTVRTATSGQRVQMDTASQALRTFNASNQVTSQYDANGAAYYTGGALRGKIAAVGGYLQIDSQAGGAIRVGEINTTGPSELYLQSKGEAHLGAPSGSAGNPSGGGISWSGNSLDLWGDLELDGVPWRRPFVVNRTWASGTSWAAYDYRDAVAVTWAALPAAPTGVIPVIMSSPGGSAPLVPRIAGKSATGCTLRVFNASGEAATINSSFSVDLIVIP